MATDAKSRVWHVYARAWTLTWHAVQSRRLWMSMATTLGGLTLLWIVGAHLIPLLVAAMHRSVALPASPTRAGHAASVAGPTWWPWVVGGGLVVLGFFLGLVPWSTARFYDRLVQELGVAPSTQGASSPLYVRGLVWFVGFFGFWFLWSLVSAGSLWILPWWGALGLGLVLLVWGLPHLFRWFGSLFVDRQPWRQTGTAWRGWQGSGLFWRGLGCIVFSTGLVIALGWGIMRALGGSPPWWGLVALGLSADLVWESVATVWMVALYIAWRSSQERCIGHPEVRS